MMMGRPVTSIPDFVQEETLTINPEHLLLKQHQENELIPCSRKKIPVWIVVLDNLPTLVLIVLGTWIISEISLYGAIAYSVYSAFSIVWFWAKICPYCHHYDTYACPCGYGIISARFFRRRRDKSFKKVFRRNLGIVFPNWFIPAIISAYLLVSQFTNELLILSAGFYFIGFLVIPLISKWVGCKNCEIKEDCPWMQRKKIIAESH
jgi:hypothetical protein